MNSKKAVKLYKSHSLETYHANFLAIYDAEIEKKFPNKTFPDFTAFCQERYKKKAFFSMADQVLVFFITSKLKKTEMNEGYFHTKDSCN